MLVDFIKKIEVEELSKFIEYRCKACNHTFTLEENEIAYCPACDCENLEVLNES